MVVVIEVLEAGPVLSWHFSNIGITDAIDTYAVNLAFIERALRSTPLKTSKDVLASVQFLE